MPGQIDDAAGSEVLHSFPHGVATHFEARGEFGFDQPLTGNEAILLEILHDA